MIKPMKRVMVNCTLSRPLHGPGRTFSPALEPTCSEQEDSHRPYLHEYTSFEHLQDKVTPVQVKDLQDHELQVEEDVRKEGVEVVQRYNQRAIQNPEKPNR